MPAQASLPAWRSARAGILALDTARIELDLYLHWDADNIAGRVETARKELTRIDAAAAAIRDCSALGVIPDTRDAILDACRTFRAVVAILGDPEAVISAANETFMDAVRASSTTARPAAEAVNSLMPLIEDMDDNIAAPYHDPEARRLYAMLSDSQQMTRAERLRRLTVLSDDDTTEFSRQVILLERAVTLFVAAERGSDDVDYASRMKADTQKGIAMLETILDAGFSPQMADAWILWRAILQYDKGMSNWGEIPNHVYNDRRNKVGAVIEQHLAGNPKDTEAMRQFVMLMSHPNIRRGEPMGHDGIYDMQTFLEPSWRQSTGSDG